MNDPFAPLIAIAQRGIPFTSSDGRAFVRLPVPSGGFYILPVRSPSYRNWFFHEFLAKSVLCLAPTPSTPSSITWKLRPATTAPPSASTSGVGWDSAATASCPPRSSSTSPIPNAKSSKSLPPGGKLPPGPARSSKPPAPSACFSSSGDGGAHIG